MHKDSPGTLQHWFLNIIHHDKTIEIPEYQRSYSWEDAHVKTLIEDLKNSKTQYFLGLFLVEESNERIYLVDGQQRFTTIYMLLNAIYKRRSDIAYQSDNKTINIKDFLFRDSLPRLVLQENTDREYFKSCIINNNTNENNTNNISNQNIKNAFGCIEEMLQGFNDNEILGILAVLMESKILLYRAEDTGMAMRIFELVNDRGKPLTNLEVVKSFLIQRIYAIVQDETTRKNHTDTVKVKLAEVYTNLYKINKYDSNLDEDSILRYHFIAFEEWSSDEYKHIKKFYKDYLTKCNDPFVLEKKADEIAKSFEGLRNIVDDIFAGSKTPWLKNLYLLNRMGSFYPLLITIKQKFDDKFLDLICNYLEIYTYKMFGIFEKRSDVSQSQFYGLARDINQKGFTQDKVLQKVKDIIKDRLHNAGDQNNDEFSAYLQYAHFYDYGLDCKYLLAKYENNLQNECKERNYINFTQFHGGKNSKENLTIEHIIPQCKPEDGYYKTIIEKSQLWGTDGYKKHSQKNSFEDNFLHSLGNLVIATHSGNSSKSNNRPEEKSWQTFLSQTEVQEIINTNKKKRGYNKDYPFNINSVEERCKKIIEFASEYWRFFTDDNGEINNKAIEERSPLI